MSRRIIIFLASVILIAGGVGIVYWNRAGETLKKSTEKAAPSAHIADVTEGVGLLPALLGFRGERTYLLLFQNNTELRPTGGFIGTYGIMTIENGHVKDFFTQGVEILDGSPAAKLINIPPPAPMKKYLGISRLLFRDANWSPDFATSAGELLEFYRREDGRKASQISGVIAFTPVVLEELLKVVGTVKVGDVTFPPESVTDALEYEVELGYKEQGLHKRLRKEIVGDFSKELFRKIGDAPPAEWARFKEIAERMLRERHIVLYDTDEAIQKQLEEEGWAGRLIHPPGDYLAWIDANLSALKSDRVIDRAISYEIRPEGKKFRARATMTYDHKGVFDWRTTRYRTYARLYAPKGSEFISAQGEREPVSVSEELGYTVFGTFASIEPQTRGALTFEFYLAPQIVAEINSGLYTFFVQKQGGTRAHGLTLDLDFGKKIVAASPPEAAKEFGDTRYRMQTDLKEDKGFAVRLK